MLRPYIHHKNKWSWFEGVCDEAAAFFDRLIDDMPSGYLSAYNTYIKGLVSAGIFAKLDVLYIYAANTSDNALLNIIKDSHNASAVSAPAHTAKEGFTGDGATKYIETNYTPSTDAVNYALNSGSIFTHEYNIVIDNLINQCVIGGSVTKLERAKNTYTYANLQGGGINNSNTAYHSYSNKVINRNNSANFQYYGNAAELMNKTNASSGISSVELYALCYNNAGTAQRFSKGTVSVIGIGAALTTGEISTIKTLTDALMSKLSML